MKKISNFTLIGYVLGIGLIIFGAVYGYIFFNHYFFDYKDMDKLVSNSMISLVFMILGAIISGLAWLYNAQLSHQHDIEAMEDYLDDQRSEIKEI